MSTPNVSVFMLERLKAWGVGRVYGYPGDGTNGLNLAFHEVGEEIEFVQVRHEELAAFAACARGAEGAREKEPPRRASSKRPNTLLASRRFKQHQSIEPPRCTRAPVCPSAISP